MKIQSFIIIIVFIINCLGCKLGSTDTKNSETNTNVNLSQDAKIKFEWSIEDLGEGEYGAPMSNIHITVNGKKILVVEKLSEGVSILEKSDFQSYKMPKEALGGISTWWAGGGNYYYAVLSGNKIQIYNAPVYEGMTDEEMYRYQVIKEFDVK